ncbi:MAG: hypothetical protein IJG87_06075 [Ruminococcus sp.]|nr:hypothetical protein [Ruminococcus sp.]
MIRKKTLKKTSKALVSLLLVLAVMVSLVPFNLTVSAEESEEAAEGSQIYAFLNYIDMSRPADSSDGIAKKADYNLELVFKNENVKDSNYFAGPYTDFADTEFVTTTYKFDTSGRPNPSWNYDQWNPNSKTSKDVLAPWIKDASRKYKDKDGKIQTNVGDNIRSVNFKNKIAPKSIAGWFYYCRYLAKFKNFENLDTSKC